MTSSKPARASAPRRVLRALFLACAAMSGACGGDSGEPAGESAAGAPVLIDEDSAVRLIAAMRELKDLSGGQPVRVGISLALGDAARPILERHGFANSLEFESLLAHAHQALQHVLLGDHAGFDGADKRYRLNFAIQEQEARLKEVQGDRELGSAERNEREAEIRLALERLRGELEDVEGLAQTLLAQYESLPAVNLETVQRHRDELLALIMRR
ncbi:MAG: hypothetical protein HY812_12020 [Planctomycetes bacterium]|nr:hypothetical protein [Planctomycetota bacterium]